LLKQNSFYWTKSLLLIGIASSLDNDSFDTIKLSITDTCPDFNLTCSSDAENENQEEEDGTTRVMPPKKRGQKRMTIHVESEVRRSPRLKNTNLSFKPESCKKKNCLACQIKPLTLKKETIRKLAVEFCNMDESDVSNDILQERKRRQYPVARARIVQTGLAPTTLPAEHEENVDPEDTVQAGQAPTTPPVEHENDDPEAANGGQDPMSMEQEE